MTDDKLADVRRVSPECIEHPELIIVVCNLARTWRRPFYQQHLDKKHHLLPVDPSCALINISTSNSHSYSHSTVSLKRVSRN